MPGCHGWSFAPFSHSLHMPRLPLLFPAFVALLLPAVIRAESNAPATLTVATELACKVVDFGTHRVTYIRIVPPQLPPLPIQPPPPPKEPTAEEQAAEDARAAKIYQDLGISGMVYVGTPTVTELTWWKEGKRYRAWSNVNFQHLTQITELETETHVFAWFPILSDLPQAEIPPESRPPELSLFTAADTTPAYFFEGTEAEMAEEAGTLLGLDYLHAYYQLHRDKLAADYAKRMEEVAIHEAHAAELAKNPPKPPDTVIHFWKMTPTLAQ